jgi:2-hydroxycyclohexanecarboxyl-CoA dehydrogenase
MSEPSFNDMGALLVGATSGIGLETARQLAQSGLGRIVLCGRDFDRGSKAADAVRGCGASQVHFVAGDAADASTISACRAAAEDIGGINILVNAVPGNSAPLPFAELDPASFASLMRAHLTSVFGITHSLLPLIRQSGDGIIINISSDAAKIPTPGESVHGALMAAIAMFSRTLALEEARNGIRVHALTPSLVADTISYDRMMAEPFSAKLFERASARAVLGLPTPADVAAAAVFLCSPAARRITGQTITINGGIAIA